MNRFETASTKSWSQRKRILERSPPQIRAIYRELLNHPHEALDFVPIKLVNLCHLLKGLPLTDSVDILGWAATCNTTRLLLQVV